MRAVDVRLGREVDDLVVPGDERVDESGSQMSPWTKREASGESATSSRFARLPA